MKSVTNGKTIADGLSSSSIEKTNPHCSWSYKQLKIIVAGCQAKSVFNWWGRKYSCSYFQSFQCQYSNTLATGVNNKQSRIIKYMG